MNLDQKGRKVAAKVALKVKVAPKVKVAQRVVPNLAPKVVQRVDPNLDPKVKVVQTVDQVEKKEENVHAKSLGLEDQKVTC